MLLRELKNRRRVGHTLMELVAAMVASSFLLAGLWSVMMIGRQIAYTPSAAVRRTEAAEVVNQMSEELRYATVLIQQTSRILEFVVADRNNDGTHEKIRYEWSGTAGAPLRKTVNGGTAITVLDSVNSFVVSVQLKAKTSTFTTTTDTSESVLVSNASSPGGSDTYITASHFVAQQINPAAFTAAVPANAISWNATKVDFQARDSSSATETLHVHFRAAGDPNDGPVGAALALKTIPETSLSGGMSWRSATFTTPARDLSLTRRYAVVFAGQGVGEAARLLYNDNSSSGVLDSTDFGGAWQFMTTRQIYYRLYGTFTVPGSSYNLTRNYVPNVQIALQSGLQSHSRIDASIPLANTPELVATHWRADFIDDPTALNTNGDSAADFGMASNGTFDTTKLINGIWYASGAMETRPLSDFTTTTIAEARLRNTSVGGNGAVLRINADRQGGQYAPLLVYVQRQSDGTQTVTLNGRTSDTLNKQLFTRARLSSDFIRVRLTILPQNNVVNLQINDDDMGSFVYPTYAPSSTTDRYLTVYADTSSAEFDYIDVRTL